MVIKPVTGMQPLPLDDPDQVAVLVDRLQEPGADTRGLGDHFAALAGTHPDWFRPYQEQVITELLDRFEVGFDDRCVLFAGAPDRCVDHLVSRLDRPSSYLEAWTLAAIGTDAALNAVADHVRSGGDRADYEDLGVWVPPVGAARHRFLIDRRAAVLRPGHRDDLAAADHPVGLRIDQVVADPPPTLAAWHYLSLRLAGIPGLPAWPAERIHLVGPRVSCGWTLYAQIDAQGSYHDLALTIDQAPDPEEVAVLRSCWEDPDRDLGALDLRPYDADLVYCNGHIHCTPAVVGTVAGPPIGLHPNPSCPTCGRLMFHITTVQNTVREYGDGFRSLYICEDCLTSACTGTGWN